MDGKMIEIIFNSNVEKKFDDTDNAWRYYIKKYKMNSEELYAKEKRITVNEKRITVNGECVFNFGTRYLKLGNIINQVPNDEKKQTLMNKLEICHELHHSLPNIMILPKFGGLNTLKGEIYYSSNYSEWRVKKGTYSCNEWFDRPDSLVCYINDYYSRRQCFDKMSFKEMGEYFSNGVFTSAIIHGETFTQLLETLDMFGDINDFCSVFYQIDDELIKSWIESGKNLVTDDVEKYLNQAFDFWSIQMRNIFEMVINDDIHIIIKGENVMKYVQEQLDNENNNKYNKRLIIEDNKINYILKKR